MTETSLSSTEPIARETFVPRHLRYAWPDADGRLHVPQIDDEDITYLPASVQDHIREVAESEELETQLRVSMRCRDTTEALEWWHRWIGRHRPASAA